MRGTNAKSRRGKKRALRWRVGWGSTQFLTDQKLWSERKIGFIDRRGSQGEAKEGDVTPLDGLAVTLDNVENTAGRGKTTPKKSFPQTILQGGKGPVV